MLHPLGWHHPKYHRTPSDSFIFYNLLTLVAGILLRCGSSDRPNFDSFLSSIRGSMSYLLELQISGLISHGCIGATRVTRSPFTICHQIARYTLLQIQIYPNQIIYNRCTWCGEIYSYSIMSRTNTVWNKLCTYIFYTEETSSTVYWTYKIIIIYTLCGSRFSLFIIKLKNWICK